MNRIDAFAIFAKVGELRSISAAARALALPKANVSRAIARLEMDYGVPLFERTTRNVAPTEIGQRLLDRCLRVLEEVDAVGAEVEAYRGQPSGTLRVGCPADVSSYLAPHMPDFLLRCPDVDLRLKVADRVLPNPSGFDLVLHVGWLTDSSLIARKIGDVPMVLVASPRFVADRPPIASPADLADLPVIGLYYADPAVAADQSDLPATVPELVLAGPSGRTPLPRWPRFASNDNRMIREMVDRGMAIAPVAEVLVRARLARGELVHVLPDHRIDPAAALYAVYASRTPPPKVRAFMDFVAEIGSAVLKP